MSTRISATTKRRRNSGAAPTVASIEQSNNYLSQVCGFGKFQVRWNASSSLPVTESSRRDAPRTVSHSPITTTKATTTENQGQTSQQPAENETGDDPVNVTSQQSRMSPSTVDDDETIHVSSMLTAVIDRGEEALAPTPPIDLPQVPSRPLTTPNSQTSTTIPINTTTSTSATSLVRPVGESGLGNEPPGVAVSDRTKTVTPPDQNFIHAPTTSAENSTHVPVAPLYRVREHNYTLPQAQMHGTTGSLRHVHTNPERQRTMNVQQQPSPWQANLPSVTQTFQSNAAYNNGPQAPRHSNLIPNQTMLGLPLPVPRKIPFPVDRLLRYLESKLADFKDTDRHVETGRLKMLRQAVIQDDLFYLVISQLHVLHDASQMLLPPPSNLLAPEVFIPLDQLFSQNKFVDPPMLFQFAGFPSQIMDIYSDDKVRDAYKQCLDQVVLCLRKLSENWQTLQSQAYQRKVIPLVEDMVEIMNIHSPTLRETLCRAVARWIFGFTALGEEGNKQLMRIHAQNAKMCTLGMRIPIERRPQAYEAMQALFEEWTLHVDFVRKLDAQRAASPSVEHHPIPEFTASNSIMRLFDVNIAPQKKTPTGPLAKRYLFPRAHARPRPVPAIPDTNTIALHQAHLRSPVLEPLVLQAGANQYYRVVQHFELSPTHLSLTPSQVISFKIDAKESGFAKSAPSKECGGRRLRKVSLGSSILRLRCVQKPYREIAEEGAWLTSAVTWHNDLSFKLNDFRLQMRRKLHHGRNLPVDVTDFVRDGTNELRVFANRLSTESRTDAGVANLYVAIERVVILSHEQVLQAVVSVSREEALARIQHAIAVDNTEATRSNGEDDDMAILSSTVNISLFDPISGAHICRVPVRGRACRHVNCFDLETFLASTTRDQPNGFVTPDAWRCPVCRGDVRPHEMIRDGFLDSVRITLVAAGAEMTRTIAVEADGTWRAKEYVRTGVRSPSLDGEENVPTTNVPAPDIIVLDDD